MQQKTSTTNISSITPFILKPKLRSKEVARLLELGRLMFPQASLTSWNSGALRRVSCWRKWAMRNPAYGALPTERYQTVGRALKRMTQLLPEDSASEIGGMALWELRELHGLSQTDLGVAYDQNPLTFDRFEHFELVFQPCH
jgi:hypothetical protein